MDELLQEFIAETIEGLAELDQQLLDLEERPDDSELIRSIFRVLHTIKGTCGFLGLSRLEAVAHASETVLGKMRDKELAYSPEVGSMLFEGLDRLKEIVDAVQTGGNFTDSTPDQPLIDLLMKIAEEAEGSITTEVVDEVSSDPAKASDAPDDNAVSDEDITKNVEAIEDTTENPDHDIVDEAALEAAFQNAEVLINTADENSNTEIDAGGEGNTEAANDIFNSKDLPSEPKEIDGDDTDGAQHSQATKPENSAEEKPEETVKKDEEDSKDQVADPAENSQTDTTQNAAHSTAKKAQPQQSEPDVTTKPEPEAMAPPPQPLTSTSQSTAESSAPKPQEGTAAMKPLEANQSVRVGVDVLDNLINLVSELVLTRNQLVQIFQKQRLNNISDTALSRLSYITSELQDEVMKTRMQPISNAWTKFPRLIRDLSRDLNKKIKLVQEGGDTEVDRQVLELIKDPLTHMMRNAADHGLELPEERETAGKSAEGTVVLKAYHEGGHIIMEITDDGRGLDPQKMKAKVLDKGLFTTQEVATMTDRQLQGVIFMPGFSTAASVTSVSGRGVGMDVVKSNIEKLGGSIDLNSTPGTGTKFIIKIPLTLTIISAVIFECAGERIAIPQISITELHRVGRRSNYRVEFVKNKPVLRLRENLLPLIFLSEEMQLQMENKAAQGGEWYVVVCRVGSAHFGIIVDKIYDTQEIVVKPLSKLIGDLKIFSGSTILGDGSIVLILDPNYISTRITANGSDNSSPKDLTPEYVNRDHEKTLLLVFKYANISYGIPLCLVSRITEYDPSALERVGDTNILHYHEKILPIVFIDNQVPEVQKDEHGDIVKMPMLMFADRGRLASIAVDEIVSIEDVRLDIEFSAKNTGVLGSLILNNTTIQILDSEHFIRIVHPEWFEDLNGTSMKTNLRPRILFVEDSHFFKNLMIPLLSMAGYEITIADNGVQALEVLKHDKRFNAIVSDIEMPQMDGYTLVSEIRKISELKDMPVLALSSRAREKDVQRGIEAGFTSHVSKSDHKLILQVLSKFKSRHLELESQENGGIMP